jgi:hypothetical protein
MNLPCNFILDVGPNSFGQQLPVKGGCALLLPGTVGRINLILRSNETKRYF